MSAGFTLTRPTYSPRDLAALYTAHVRPISYATVLKWIEQGANSNGTSGVKALKEPVSGYYRIPADEVERVLLAAGATKG